MSKTSIPTPSFPNKMMRLALMNEIISIHVQDETKARRDLCLWRGSPQTRAALICSDSSEAHIRSDLQRASNEARGSKT
jgi:hypothetical protein